MKLRQIFSQKRVIIIVGIILVTSILFLCNLPYYVTEGFDGDSETSTNSPDTSAETSTTAFDPTTNEPDMQDAITITPDTNMNLPNINPDHSSIQATVVANSEIPSALIPTYTTHSNKGVFKKHEIK